MIIFCKIPKDFNIDDHVSDIQWILDKNVFVGYHNEKRIEIKDIYNEFKKYGFYSSDKYEKSPTKLFYWILKFNKLIVHMIDTEHGIDFLDVENVKKAIE